jgi:hypothetical protein
MRVLFYCSLFLLFSIVRSAHSAPLLLSDTTITIPLSPAPEHPIPVSAATLLCAPSSSASPVWPDLWRNNNPSNHHQPANPAQPKQHTYSALLPSIQRPVQHQHQHNQDAALADSSSTEITEEEEVTTKTIYPPIINSQQQKS